MVKNMPTKKPDGFTAAGALMQDGLIIGSSAGLSTMIQNGLEISSSSSIVLLLVTFCFAVQFRFDRGQEYIEAMQTQNRTSRHTWKSTLAAFFTAETTVAYSLFSAATDGAKAAANYCLGRT